jgi:capsular polysaccharide transport system ATP-binding protein
MIQFKGVSKKYKHRLGSKWVLNDINFTIPKGVSVGLIGKNGAGKSTLLQLLGGMDVPDKGEIIRDCSMSWPIGLKGGFQPSMTGRQNVKFVSRVHGFESKLPEIIEYVKEFSELGTSFDEPIKTYSSGMRSRLAFGLSLAFDFDVYLSDEATAVGDKSFKAKAQKAFEDKVGKATLIMVSHSEGILKKLCTSGIFLRDGRAYWFDDINEAINEYHRSIEI